MAAAFAYAPELVEEFPTIRGGVIAAHGLANGPTPEPLLAAYAAEQAAAIDRIGDRPLSELPSLAAWRRAFRAFGVDPTQYRSAAEALLRRLTKRGEIPSLNLLVDLGNLVSIRHALPVAVFDTAATTGEVTVRRSDGTERFTELGSTDAVHPVTGEVVFVDQDGLVSARRWCWRQSAQSAAGIDTTSALITIEGLHDGATVDVEAGVSDLLALLQEQVPGVRLESAEVSPTVRRFSPDGP